ncbi:MAG: hypothetical protein FJ096_19155 [Deltaproteobacteria bacterium]|nr:hypothetical protein [Deltaproteobacteria bacterium]
MLSPRHRRAVRRTALAFTLAFALAAGCDEAPPGVGSPTATSGGGAAIPCTEDTVDTACGPTNDCRAAACVSDTCEITTAKKGASCSGENGATVCDGKGACVLPSCIDGKKGPSETDVDCGGPCGPCELDDGCAKNADCQSGHCGPTLDIGKNTCQPCDSNDQCNDDRFCDPSSKTCVPDKPIGTACGDASECPEGHCVDGFCCDSACDEGCTACSVARGALTDGACEPYVFKNTDVPGACDDTSANCGAGLRCTCDGAGICTAKLGVIGVTAGANHSCALFTTGQVKCWGANESGQLGLGDTMNRGDAPGQMGTSLPFVDLGPGARVTALAAGDAHTCARLDDGAVKCWGANASGQLGQGDTLARGGAPGQLGAALLPVDLGAGKKATAIAAGGNHSCARLDNGTVKCWGANASGQLGQGDVAARGITPGQLGDALAPVDLGTATNASTIAAAGDHTCALVVPGNAVKCWGANASGQLGQGDVANRGGAAGQLGNALLPVKLGDKVKVKSLTLTATSSCARLENGSFKCWGDNASGQLGLGDAQNRGDAADELGDLLPAVALGNLAVVDSAAGGGSHVCARLTSSSLKCWGANTNGQLGQGDLTNRGDGPNQMGDALLSVNLGTKRVALVVATGDNHTCARLDDGTVKCWGLNTSGQLGLGDIVARGGAAGELGDALPTVALFE